MCELEHKIHIVEEAEYDTMKERGAIIPENPYLTRGLNMKPSLGDKTRNFQNCSCSKLSSIDWVNLFDIEEDASAFKIIEVRFKNSRKDFFLVENPEINLETGDIVVVDAEQGYDIGLVSLKGALAYMQYHKNKKPKAFNEIKKLLRKATEPDVIRWNQSILTEQSTFERSRQIAAEQKISMKINDVEYQGDGSKATFFYTADERVDFRQLIKLYASEFKIRIEMRQIGSRQESMHIGGIGVCGRELCCVTFLSNFYSVSTQTTKVQQLSSNLQKLAGKCGKLKCCLNFEYETYQEIVKDFPDNETKLRTQKGDAFWQKTDVFNKLMYYSYFNNRQEYICLNVDKVKEIIDMNRNGNHPVSLEIFSVKNNADDSPEETTTSSATPEDITRFDNKNQYYHSKNNKNRNNRNNNNNNNNNNR